MNGSAIPTITFEHKRRKKGADSLKSKSLAGVRTSAISESRINALSGIWHEVADAIVEEMLAHENGVQRELHINIKPEMALELAKLTLFFADKVVAKRTADRDIEQIDPEAERLACLGPEGTATIKNTARLAYEEVWLKFLQERWLPKSRKAIERETLPQPSAKLPIKPVRNKHFISRWFIRDYWANGPQATCWRKVNDAWARCDVPFGRWGHRRKLWSDKLEAYFSLLEGDAKRPIQMLLAVEPLNQPQQLAFIAHLVIHLLRNPRFIGALRTGLRGMHEQTAREMGTTVDDVAQNLYETLYQNNELYDRYARPLLWSQWAMVASPEPVFVLPDTFCAHDSVDGQHRLVVPLTPFKCFVTLAAKESEKRVVPFQLKADTHLARRMSRLLVQSATSEFLSHGSFSLDAQVSSANFSDILRDVETALSGKAP